MKEQENVRSLRKDYILRLVEPHPRHAVVEVSEDLPSCCSCDGMGTWYIPTVLLVCFSGSQHSAIAGIHVVDP